MNKKNLKRIYKFLELYLIDKLQYPCDNCNYFECKKNTLNKGNIIKNKYKWNDIDWKKCLKKEKEQLNDILDLLKIKEFKLWSFKKCDLCKNKFFKHNLKIHSESKASTYKKKMFKIKIVKLCKECNKSYVHRKKALHKGYEKL